MKCLTCSFKPDAVNSDISRISLLIPKVLLRDIETIALNEGRNRSEQIRFFLSIILARRKTVKRKVR